MPTMDSLKEELRRINGELATEGDPSKRTLLKLQKINLEFELSKQTNEKGG